MHVQKVRIAQSNHVLYVNQNDRRGKYLITEQGVTSPALTTFWRTVVRNYQPTIVLDVGANYGEVVFSTTYHPQARIIGIEANPELISYIERSLAEHPNQQQMEIVHAIASSEEKKGTVFYIHTDQSGKSSVLPRHEQALKKQEVNSIKIDQLFADDLFSTDRLLFKIDVEGYEEHVLQGMQSLIQQTKSCVGYMEFNDQFLTEAGTHIDQFLDDLNDQFNIYHYDSPCRLTRIKPYTVRDIRHYYDKPHAYTDLILLSKNIDVHVLGF